MANERNRVLLGPAQVHNPAQQGQQPRHSSQLQATAAQRAVQELAAHMLGGGNFGAVAYGGAPSAGLAGQAAFAPGALAQQLHAAQNAQQQQLESQAATAAAASGYLYQPAAAVAAALAASATLQGLDAVHVDHVANLLTHMHLQQQYQAGPGQQLALGPMGPTLLEVAAAQQQQQRALQQQGGMQAARMASLAAARQGGMALASIPAGHAQLLVRHGAVLAGGMGGCVAAQQLQQQQQQQQQQIPASAAVAALYAANASQQALQLAAQQQQQTQQQQQQLLLLQQRIQQQQQQQQQYQQQQAYMAAALAGASQQPLRAPGTGQQGVPSSAGRGNRVDAVAMMSAPTVPGNPRQHGGIALPQQAALQQQRRRSGGRGSGCPSQVAGASPQQLPLTKKRAKGAAVLSSSLPGSADTEGASVSEQDDRPGAADSDTETISSDDYFISPNRPMAATASCWGSLTCSVLAGVMAALQQQACLADMLPAMRSVCRHWRSVADAHVEALCPAVMKSRLVVARFPALHELHLTHCANIRNRDLLVLARSGLRLATLTLGDDRVRPWVSNRGLNFICRLTLLTRLTLQDCNSVTNNGLLPLRNLTGLTYLSLRGCRKLTNAGMDALKPLACLQALVLQGVQRLSDKGLAALCGLSALRAIELGQTRVHDEGLQALAAPGSGLTGLTALALAHEDVTDAGLRALAALTRLTRLALRDVAELSGDTLAALLAHLPHLQSLDLMRNWTFSNAQLDKCLGALALQGVSSLDLRTTWVNEEGVAALAARLPALRHLAISPQHEMWHKYLQVLPQLTQLHSLALSNLPSLPYQLIDALAPLTGLQALDLAEPELSAAGGGDGGAGGGGGGAQQGGGAQGGGHGHGGHGHGGHGHGGGGAAAAAAAAVQGGVTAAALANLLNASAMLGGQHPQALVQLHLLRAIGDGGLPDMALVHAALRGSAPPGGAGAGAGGIPGATSPSSPEFDVALELAIAMKQPVRPMAVAALCRLTSLTSLDLSRRNIRPLDLAHIGRALPRLTRLAAVQCCMPLAAAAAAWEARPDLVLERRSEVLQQRLQ